MSAEGAAQGDDSSWPSRSVWLAAYLLTASSTVVLLLSWPGILIVVGSHVVSTWAAAPALLAVGTAARLVLSRARIPRPSLPHWWRGALMASTWCAWMLVPLGAAWQLVGSPSYTVARHRGAVECRVVVVESSFLFAGAGTVYVAGGWSPFAQRVGSYITDDGARPVRDDGLDVTWGDANGGRVSGHLSITDAYDGREISFTCG